MANLANALRQDDFDDLRESRADPFAQADLRRVQLDIHDGPLQAIAAVRAELHVMQERAKGLSGAEDAGILDEIEEANARLGDVIEDLREIITAAPAHHGPLRPLVESAVEVYADCIDVDLRFDLDSDEDAALTDSQRSALERIVQSALANVIQHSRAERVVIAIRPNAGGVLLEMVDEGVGFDVEEAVERAGREGRLGLEGMLERVRRLGGEAAIASAPGGPTRLCAFLPRAAPVARIGAVPG